MSLFDEDLPKPKTDAPTPRVLEKLSVEELREYIIWLESEIQRCKDDIARKDNVKQAADAFFKKAT